MVNSNTAVQAQMHLAQLGSKKLSQFVEVTGPIEIPDRYGEDALLGLLSIVVAQQLSNQAARSIWNRLIDQYPDRTNLLSTLRKPETSNFGLSRSKRRTMQKIAALGDEWLNELRKQPEDMRAAKLLEIWGLGYWSVTMWELFIFRGPDNWSDNDLILKRVSQYLAHDADIDRQTFITSASPFRSFLSLYCWRLNNVKKKAQ